MHASLDDYEQVVLRSFGQVADALEALDHDAGTASTANSPPSAISSENLTSDAREL